MAQVSTDMTQRQGLLIGGAGMLGREVHACLAKRGLSYRFFTRDLSRVPAQISPDQIFEGDLSDFSSVEEAVKGAAWIVYVPTNTADKIKHAEHIAKAAKLAGVQLVIKTSAILAGQTPPLSFGIEHVVAEDRIADSGVDWIVLRPSVFMQTFSMFSKPMRQSGKMIVPVPTGKTAFIDMRDIGESVARCLADPAPYIGKRLSLTGPEALSMREVASLFSTVQDKEISHMAPPRFVAGLIMRWGEKMDPWLVNRLKQLFKALEENREGTVSSNVETITGVQPVSFADYLTRDEQARRLWAS